MPGACTAASSSSHPLRTKRMVASTMVMNPTAMKARRCPAATIAFGFVVEKFNLFALTLLDTSSLDEAHRMLVRSQARNVRAFCGMVAVATDQRGASPLSTGTMPPASGSGCGNVAFECGVEQLTASLFGQRNRIATCGRIDQRHLDDGIDAGPVDAEPLQVMRNTGLLAQIEHRYEEPVEPVVDLEEACKALDLRLDRRAVEHDNIGLAHVVGHEW